MCNCKPDDIENNVPIQLHHENIVGHRTVRVDPCIAPLVQSLNAAGYQTTSSCCGHNHQPGNIRLEDGRWILVVKDFETMNRITNLFPDTFGNKI